MSPSAADFRFRSLYTTWESANKSKKIESWKINVYGTRKANRYQPTRQLMRNIWTVLMVKEFRITKRRRKWPLQLLHSKQIWHQNWASVVFPLHAEWKVFRKQLWETVHTSPGSEVSDMSVKYVDEVDIFSGCIFRTVASDWMGEGLVQVQTYSNVIQLCSCRNNLKTNTILQLKLITSLELPVAQNKLTEGCHVLSAIN